MPAEIERKFLVADDSWRDGTPGVRIAQGYLSQDPDRTVRVRIGGEKAWLTIKGRTHGITHAEFEYAIPVDAVAPPSSSAKRWPASGKSAVANHRAGIMTGRRIELACISP